MSFGYINGGNEVPFGELSQEPPDDLDAPVEPELATLMPVMAPDEMVTPCELRSVRLAAASNGPNVFIELELPVAAISTLATVFHEGLQLYWKPRHGPMCAEETLIASGASWKGGPLARNADGNPWFKMTFVLSADDIVTSLGNLGVVFYNARAIPGRAGYRGTLRIFALR